MNRELYLVLARAWIEQGRLRETLALRATCREAGMMVTTALLDKIKAYHAVFPRRCFIPIAECMVGGCEAKGKMLSYRRYDEEFVVFCPHSVLCRIAVLVNATARHIYGSEGNLWMRPVPEWLEMKPFKVLRTGGYADPGWTLFKGEWAWDHQRQDIRLHCQKWKVDQEPLVKWCWLSDLERENDDFALPRGGKVECHTIYSLGRDQIPFVDAIEQRIPSVLERTYGITKELADSYVPN